jgi:hypothetical protein
MSYIRDYISLNEFLPVTQQGLIKFCEDYDLFDPTQITLPDAWAELWFIMRTAPDNDYHFTSGKWATLQRLEGFLNEYARGRITKSKVQGDKS